MGNSCCNTIRKKLHGWGFVLPSMPRAVKYSLWIACAFALVPIAVIYHARMVKSTLPRVHPIQDMDNQPGFRAQASSPIFADGRAARQPILTTVAWGHLEEDDHYFRGYEVTGKDAQPKYFTGMPQGVTVNKALLDRGQERFNIYCAPCHGYDGQGNGSVNVRAGIIGAGGTGWTPPANLTLEATIGKPDGEIYNAIRNGIRTMPAMGSQVPAQDRWAIVAYVRALQLSQAGAQAQKPAAPVKSDSK